jgi:hypothetical protein
VTTEQLARRGARRLPAVLIAIMVPAMALVVSGCGSSPSSHAASTTTTTVLSALHAPLHVKYGTGSIGPADPTTTVPKEGGLPLSALFGAGQSVIIGAKGCEPQTLESNVAAPVVWTNLSGRPQRVVFAGGAVDSGTIAPGGTFTWSTTQAIALVYRVVPSGSVCKLEVNQANP